MSAPVTCAASAIDAGSTVLAGKPVAGKVNLWAGVLQSKALARAPRLPELAKLGKLAAGAASNFSVARHFAFERGVMSAVRTPDGHHTSWAVAHYDCSAVDGMDDMDGVSPRVGRTLRLAT